VSADTDNTQLALPSLNAAPSQRINYVLFETNDPFADKVGVARRVGLPAASRSELYAAANTGPGSRFHQIYMRYLGPKPVKPG
jgi:hypothetical protein